MKRTIEIEPICPFIGKECISSGFPREIAPKAETIIMHPCAFWDGDELYNGVTPDEPCRIKRAISRILADEISEEADNDNMNDVPWTVEEGSGNNGSKAKGRNHVTK